MEMLWNQSREAEAQRVCQEYRRLLDTVARSVLGNRREDCEECVQDAIWSYVSSPERWDPERGSERTYLCVLTRSQAIDRRRQLEARREAPLEDCAGGLTAEDHMERAVVRDGLRRALDSLSPQERRLFTLHFLYQWPSREIGEVLGLTPNAVDARTARLRKKLKRLLALQGLGMEKGAEHENL